MVDENVVRQTWHRNHCAFLPWFCSIHEERFCLRICLFDYGNLDWDRFDSSFEEWTIDLFFV